jgi:hypothetical protein
MSDTVPDTIWLQFYGLDACDMRAEFGDGDWEQNPETTWCEHQQYDTDIVYRRADLHSLPGVDELAQIIRRVDGNNALGAGALAEAILAAVERKP